MSTAPAIITVLRPVKSREQQLAEQRLGEPIEDFLRRRYVVEKAIQEDLATEIGVDRGTVSRWMAQFGIPSRADGPRRRPS